MRLTIRTETQVRVDEVETDAAVARITRTFVNLLRTIVSLETGITTASTSETMTIAARDGIYKQYRTFRIEPET